MLPNRVTPPAADPVSLEEAKEHLRVFHNDDDMLIGDFIKSAVDHLDGYRGILGRAIITQTWRVGFGQWLPVMHLPFPDVSGLDLTYRDADGADQTVADSGFEFIASHRGTLVFFREAFSSPTLSGNTAEPITMTFTAGYGDAADVPQDIKTAIKLMVQLDYDQPEQQKAMAIQQSIRAKIEKHRWTQV